MNHISVLLAALLLGGCASTATPNYDMRFGDAVRDARNRMIVNPAPTATAEATMGIDGKASYDAVGRYHDTFKAPPPVVNVINIGGQIGK